MRYGLLRHVGFGVNIKGKEGRDGQTSMPIITTSLTLVGSRNLREVVNAENCFLSIVARCKSSRTARLMAPSVSPSPVRIILN